MARTTFVPSQSGVMVPSKPLSLRSRFCVPQLQCRAPSSTANGKRRSVLTVRAESGGLRDFFNKDGSKQDAARKALQDAFAGKTDPFAVDEKRRKERGGGGNGGGGGGGGGFNFQEWSDGFGKWIKNTLRGIAATLAFFAFISLFYLWKPLLDLVSVVVRKVLRLDNSRMQVASGTAATPDLSKKEHLGNVEEAVINKWAGEDVGGEEDEDEDGDEFTDEDDD